MRTHLCVVNIMNFIENDEFHVPDQVGAAVKHAPQNLGRHLEGKASTTRYRRLNGQLTIRHGASGLICTSPVRIPTFSAP